MSQMAFTDDLLGRGLDAIGRIGKTVLIPWGGADACLDAYESALRAVTNHQLNAARAIEVEPVRAILAASAHLTRDIGAAHLSAVRWILDV
jgi:hypothetical protein